MRRQGRHALRHRLYEILKHGPVGDLTGRLVGRLIVLLIVINLVAVALESVPEFEARYAVPFLAIELLSLLVFTSEYALRMWVAVEHTPYRHARGWEARLRYATSPLGLIDLFAVLPFWLAFALPSELKILLVFRIIHFLKLAHYSPGMRSLLDVLYAERRALFGCLVILIGALLAATAMHLVERQSSQRNSAQFLTRCGGPSSRTARLAMATWCR
jgi:voltage-gated potassium channel